MQGGSNNSEITLNLIFENLLRVLGKDSFGHLQNIFAPIDTTYFGDIVEGSWGIWFAYLNPFFSYFSKSRDQVNREANDYDVSVAWAKMAPYFERVSTWETATSISHLAFIAGALFVGGAFLKKHLHR
jgi:hypothetical protein